MEQISEKFSFKGYGVHIYHVVTDGQKWHYDIVITSPIDRRDVDEYRECRECSASNAQDVIEIAKQFAISFISKRTD